MIIAKFESDLSDLISATYLGGAGNDEALAIGLDNAKSI